MTRGKNHAKKVDFIMEHKDKMSRKELAQLFGIGTPAICKIIKKKERAVNSQEYFNIDAWKNIF